MLDRIRLNVARIVFIGGALTALFALISGGARANPDCGNAPDTSTSTVGTCQRD